MVFQFGFPAGLAALAIALPLVIIYLRRPKAMTRTIPSLMFFSEHKGRLRSSSLFRKFVRNILFLVQLLALLVLAVSCSEPHVTTNKLAFLDDTILVLDTSASMTQVFPTMLGAARKNIGAQTSIVLAGAPIQVPLEYGTPDRALGVISGLEPTDRSANLDSAFLQALAIAERDPVSSRIVVITDRRSQLSSSLVDLARQKGHATQLIDVGQKIDGNVGITGANVAARKVDISVRNYGSEAKNVTISGSNRSVQLELLPRSIERVSFPISEGTHVFRLSPGDSFSFDDALYVSDTARSRIKALIVTTSDSTLPVERALGAINSTTIDITKNRLGTIQQDYDLIIMSDYATELILPSFYTEARSQVQNGAILVVGKNSKAGSVPDSLMPVVVQGQLAGVQDASSQGSQLADAVSFTPAVAPLDTYPVNGSVTIATAGATDLITLRPIGSGASIFYGYDDLKDSFPNTPYYPIFWSNIVDQLTGADAVSRFNVQTGSVRTLPSPAQVTYPDGSTRTTSTIAFDRAGFYKVGSYTFAANTLDQSESDPSLKAEAFDASSSGPQRIQVDIPLTSILAIVALVLVFLELFITKKRGEL